MYIGYCQECGKYDKVIAWSGSVIVNEGYEWEDSLDYSECIGCWIKHFIHKITFSSLRYQLFKRGKLKLFIKIIFHKYETKLSLKERIIYSKLLLK